MFLMVPPRAVPKLADGHWPAVLADHPCHAVFADQSADNLPALHRGGDVNDTAELMTKTRCRIVNFARSVLAIHPIITQPAMSVRSRSWTSCTTGTLRQRRSSFPAPKMMFNHFTPLLAGTERRDEFLQELAS
jgi:hypothetical protein